MPDLQLTGVSKTYSQPRTSGGFMIRSISLDIREGERFAILGASGCGKTTLLKLIAGLIHPDEGIVRLGSADLTSVPAERRGFGMVFQQPLLFPHMTVLENIAFGLKMNGIGKRERQERAVEMMAAVGLEGYEYRYPNELSGGQQQRVSLARAIVTRPKLLLMDEPFSALDPGIRTEMRLLVMDIHWKFGMTMLFVTHDRDEAFEIADRIAVMHEGSVLQTGRPMDVYGKPNSPFVAKFIGAGNVLKGELKNGIFRSGKFTVACSPSDSKVSGAGWLVIRPELFRIDSGEEQGAIHGIVRDLRFRQGFYQIIVDIGEVSLEVMEKTDGTMVPQAGDSLRLALDTSQVHFIPGKGGHGVA